MGPISLKCGQPAAKAVYDYLIKHDYAKNLDLGFRVIDYQNPANPKGTLVSAGDGQVVCEELWENSLIILDELGQKNEDAQKYQAFRRLIETQTKRPIPWILEAPTIGVSLGKQRSLVGSVGLLRQKVLGAIKKLNDLLGEAQLNTMQRQKCLIACLWWFVLVPEDGIGEPLDEQRNPQLAPFLIRQGLNEGAVKEIKGPFSEYLQKSGGGLGLASVKTDAKTEATALETVLEKRGWCTEQSKVMYAVLRMAGIEAFFVEPRLSVEYLEAKKFSSQIPLQGHMASGVGVKIRDENGKEKIWILDAALKLLEADYVDEKPGQWNAHPYWELSLRHFYMADLANLGNDQIRGNDLAKAEQSLKMALDMGEDSTAFHAMGNYAWLLSKKSKQLACHFKDRRKICGGIDKNIDEYTRKAVAINPHDPAVQFSRGKFLVYQYALEEAVGALLESIEADSRYIFPYQKLGSAIYEARKKSLELFSSAWENFENQMRRIVVRHPKLKRDIKKGLKEMKAVIVRSARSSQEGKELVDLIEKLESDLKLWLE